MKNHRLRTRLVLNHITSTNSCRVEVTLRLTWFVKLSNINRSLPSTQVKKRSHAMSLEVQDDRSRHSTEQRRTGKSWSAQIVSGSFPLRAARDQVLLRACTSMVEEWSWIAGVAEDVTVMPSISARTFRKALARMSADRAPGKAWCSVLREGIIFCKAGLETRAKASGSLASWNDQPMAQRRVWPWTNSVIA